MSASPASLAVMPLLPRSMPMPRLAKMELFWMLLPVPDATATPILPLLAMIFPSPAAVPPIALLVAAAVICTPIELLPKGLVPLAATPMKLPRKVLPVAEAPVICTPKPALGLLLPEMILPAPATLPPNRIAGCIVYNYTNSVWQGSSACGVGADVVAEYRVESGIGVENLDAEAVIAGNDVAIARSSPADRVAASILYQHASQGVAQVCGAVDIGADEVAHDSVACGSVAGSRGVLNEYTESIIAGNDIARTCGISADRVVGRILNSHPKTDVAQVCGTVDVGADEVAQ